MNLSQRMAVHIIRNRFWYLTSVLVFTGFFAYFIPKVKILSLLIDLFPKDHEFVETYKEYQDVFGGANTIMLALEVKEGDIFNPKTLAKIRCMTKGLEQMPGVINYQILSLSQRKVKNITIDSTGTFSPTPLMWPDVPRTEDEANALKELVHATRVHGSLVSLDDKSALFVAGFFDEQEKDPKADRVEKNLINCLRQFGLLQEEVEEIDEDIPSTEDKIPLDYEVLYKTLKMIASYIEDGNTSVHMIGRPVMLGYILTKYPSLTWIFFATILAMVAILALNFRDFRGVAIPIITAVLSAIWGLGLLGILEINFDPLVLVVPFIISARALSHSVQLIERFNEEYARTKDKLESARATFSGLWEPGFVGIVADALGILAVWFTPIPLMEKLAVMGGFWAMSIVVTDLIFNPVILSILPPPSKIAETQRLDVLGHTLSNIGHICKGRNGYFILTGFLVLLVVGFLFARKVVVGDMYPGTPMLWHDSEYNLDTEAIQRKFSNTDILNVIVEGDGWNAIKSPDVLNKMHGLQREMEAMPEVGGTSSIADLIPPLIRAMHGGDPRWELVPTDGRESGFFLEMIYGASEPGDLTRFITVDSRHANIAIYLKDHKGETLRKVVGKARQYIETHPMDHAKFRLAGGFAGLLSAVNDVVMRTEALVTFLAFFSVFLFCALSYKSVLAGFFFMIPLIISNYLTYAIMGLKGIGLDVNALPVVSLGVGLGVDYGLYIVSRIKEEYSRTRDLELAITISMATAGKAVLLTAITMVAGVVFWTFSFLRFQADMGLLLVFWMINSMIGSLLLLPTLISLFRPRFVIADR